MATVFIGVGSNLGDRADYINQALVELREREDIQLIQDSKVYETDPVGGPEGQGKYLNSVWKIETLMSPEDLLDLLLSVEKKLGRERLVKNSPRTIDLDILFYEDQVLDSPELKIPHPRLHERSFVLKPLCDLNPKKVHPVLNKTVEELMSVLNERN